MCTLLVEEFCNGLVDLVLQVISGRISLFIKFLYFFIFLFFWWCGIGRQGWWKLAGRIVIKIQNQEQK
jgi:hypothetical protein